MKKSVLFGISAGIAALAAVAVLVNKTSNDVKNSFVEEEIDSPFGNNWIKISFGSSDTAKGLICIKIKAESDSVEDDCKLIVFAKKDAAVSYEWQDNEHFRFLVGSGKRKQCCDVAFDEKNITANYYLMKTE